MKKDIEFYKKYCTGCGLCHSVSNIEFNYLNGFYWPNLTSENLEFCESYCPSSGKYSAMLSGDIFGKFENVYSGWSNRKDIRFKASSGGIITEICCYLLDNNIVDYVIQTGVDDNAPYKTKTYISNNSKDVERLCGSRYSESQPLKKILQMIDTNKKYAFVGKPCDIQALYMFMEQNEHLKSSILYLLSFFCAGQPSYNAQKKLLNKLGCSEISQCKQLEYRGHGWPGFAKVTKKDGTTSAISYEESWGSILGRDIRPSCRLCLDGIGELSDISCGDYWYLNNNKKPSFEEGKGRNVIFARSKKGNELIKSMAKDGIVNIDEIGSINDFKIIQEYQYIRKTTMYDVLRAIKLFGKNIPDYDTNILKIYKKQIDKKTRLKRFVGTLRRCYQKRI